MSKWKRAKLVFVQWEPGLHEIVFSGRRWIRAFQEAIDNRTDCVTPGPRYRPAYFELFGTITFQFADYSVLTYEYFGGGWRIKPAPAESGELSRRSE